MYAVNDTTLLKQGHPVETFSTHSKAVAAAEAKVDRPTSATTLKKTANVVVALDFDDAETFVAIVDTEAAQLADVAAETDPEAVAALMKRGPAEIEAAHAVEIKAKSVDHSFSHGGTRYPEGSFVALIDGDVVAFGPVFFAERWKLKEAKAGRRRKPAGSD